MSVIGYSEMLLNDDDMLRDFKTAREFLKIMNTAARILRKCLVSDGHSVVTANRAEQALGFLEGAEFDLVITDHAMPGTNGAQPAATIRGKHAGQPVILAAGFAAGSLGEDEDPAEVDLVMRKPVPRRELRRAVASVMGV